MDKKHFPSIAGDDDITAVFEESQKRFSLPKQGVAAQFTQAAGSSRGVNVTLLNHPDEQNISSHIPNEFPQSERKRLCDRAYRERLKNRRNKMESDLRMVGRENEELKLENRRLRSEKDGMDQYLQARAAENQRLKSQIYSLRGKIGEQQVLVDAFSRKLLLTNHEDQQLFNLRNENARLRQNVIWTDQMEEKQRLLDRRVDLRRQNRVLKTQVQALCEKIYKDQSLGERQA